MSSVQLQYGESAYVTISGQFLVNSQGIYYELSSADAYNAGCTFTGDYTMSVIITPDEYHTINANYIPIDGTSIIIQGGVLKSLGSVPSEIRVNKIEGYTNQWNYIDLSGYGCKIRAKYSDVYIGINDISTPEVNAKGELKDDATNTQTSFTNIVRAGNSIPAAPSSDGTYVLKCTVSDGTPTYSWVAE